MKNVEEHLSYALILLFNEITFGRKNHLLFSIRKQNNMLQPEEKIRQYFGLIAYL